MNAKTVHVTKSAMVSTWPVAGATTIEDIKNFAWLIKTYATDLITQVQGLLV
jgi:hypothetical protein